MLGAVFGTALSAIRYAGTIKRAANGVITNTRQVFYATATNQYDRVLLKIMSLATNVAGDFETVGQTNTSDLPHSRVRLFRSRCIDTCANTAALGRTLKRWSLAFGDL